MAVKIPKLPIPEDGLWYLQLSLGLGVGGLFGLGLFVLFSSQGKT
jgi:hypothetical protein